MGKRFIDQKNYPRGFSRSGDFTIAQATLLEQYGYRMQALSEGSASAEDEREQAFIEALVNQDKDHPWAVVWIQYQQKIQGKKRIRTLCDTPRAGLAMSHEEIFDSESD